MKSIQMVMVALLIAGVQSCGELDPNEQVDEGSVVGNIYTSEDLGWTIEIPAGWEVISKDQLDESTEKGAEAMEQLTGEIDFSGLKHLIGFQLDRANLFQSTIEPFELEYEGEWEENNAAIKELLYATYTSQGIALDTASSQSHIDGLDFQGFHMTLYSPSGEVVLTQDIYNRWHEGFDFSVNLNYNSDENREVLEKVWRGSKFRKG